MGCPLYFCVVALVFVSAYASPLFPKSLPVETSASEIEPSYRLPNNTIPLNYKIHITTNVHEEKFGFDGVVTIKLKVITASKNAAIVLHARRLTIGDVTLAKQKSEGETEPPIKDIGHKVDTKTEFVTVTKNGLEFKEDEIYILTIKYNGTLREDNGGFYKSSYINAQNKTVYLATTQFESTDARHGFPCYDEPAIKATFDISITHGKDYNAISNMPAVKPTANQVASSDEKMVTTKFEKTPPMSTYLIAFVVSDFQNTTENTQRVFSRPNAKEEQDFALKTGLKTLTSLGTYLGIDYKLPKMDQIAVPDFAAGAMENWGLVTYREEYLLYNRKKSTVYTQTNIATIIAHEYAHQWFGNLVSPFWWTFIWLNEGFASLFSYIGTDKVFPEWGIMEYFITAEYQRALEADVGAQARPMTHYVESPKDIVSLFDSISYSKASCVLRMMQNVLTEETFKLGLNKYLTKMSFGAAKEVDLIEGLQKAVDENGVKLPATVEEIMTTWTTQGGFPLLTVTRDYTNGTFKIAQQTFHNDKTTTDSKTWWIPFNFATAAKPNFEDTSIDGFLKKQQKTIEVAPTKKQNWTNTDWIIMNKQQTGYYRVNYDEQNWNLIIAALEKDPKTIHTYNRAQLLNDAFRFLLTKSLPVKTMFSLLTYLKQEEHYSPWAAANSAFNAFNLYLRQEEDANLLHFFIRNIVEPVYKKLGTKDKDGDLHFTSYTRTLAIKWACEAGMEECLKNTNSRLSEFVKDNSKTIEPNMQEAIYCYGLKRATDEEFNFFYKTLLTSVDAAERKLIISSLGCAAKPDQLKKFLESSINKSINLRPQERITLLRAAYIRGPTGFTAVLEFLKKNHKQYADLTPGFLKKNPLMDDITQMSTIVTNTDQKKELTAILKLAEAHVDYDPNVGKVVDKNVQINLDWIASHRADIIQWLEVFHKSKSGASHVVALPILLLLVSLIHLFH